MSHVRGASPTTLFNNYCLHLISTKSSHKGKAVITFHSLSFKRVLTHLDEYQAQLRSYRYGRFVFTWAKFLANTVADVEQKRVTKQKKNKQKNPGLSIGFLPKLLYVEIGVCAVDMDVG